MNNVALGIVKHIAKWTLGTFAVLAVALSSLLYSCSYFLCDNEIVTQLPSPDEKYKAVVFVRDCGATTTWSTHVSLIRSWSWVGRDDGGNTFVMDAGDGAPEGPGRGPEARVRWISAHEIVIAHHRLAEVFRAEKQVGGVTIRYEDF